MITKLKRNPKFDIPYHDTYVFELDFLDEYIDLLRRLNTFTGIVSVATSIGRKPTTHKGTIVVDKYQAPENFYEQLTQKTFNYED